MPLLLAGAVAGVCLLFGLLTAGVAWVPGLITSLLLSGTSLDPKMLRSAYQEAESYRIEAQRIIEEQRQTIGELQGKLELYRDGIPKLYRR